MGEHLPADPAGAGAPPWRSRVRLDRKRLAAAARHRSSARAPSISARIMATGCRRVGGRHSTRSYAGGVDLRAWMSAPNTADCGTGSLTPSPPTSRRRGGEGRRAGAALHRLVVLPPPGTKTCRVGRSGHGPTGPIPPDGPPRPTRSTDPGARPRGGRRRPPRHTLGTSPVEDARSSDRRSGRSSARALPGSASRELRPHAELAGPRLLHGLLHQLRRSDQRSRRPSLFRDQVVGVHTRCTLPTPCSARSSTLIWRWVLATGIALVVWAFGEAPVDGGTDRPRCDVGADDADVRPCVLHRLHGIHGGVAGRVSCRAVHARSRAGGPVHASARWSP